MRRRDDEGVIVTNVVHEYIEIGGVLTYKASVRDGRPEWTVYLTWDDGYERLVYNGRTGDPKRLRLMDSVGKFHQSIMPGDTSVTIGLVPVEGPTISDGSDED